MAKTETVDEELVAGLKLAKTKRCGFALVVKGASDGALVIAKQKVPPVLITLAKKKCGGSSVIEGAVFFEDGTYVFETGQPPAATLPNALKLIAKRDAGMTIVAICRQGTEDAGPASPTGMDASANGATGAKPSEVSSKATGGDDSAKLDATYQQRVRALTDNLKKAIASGTSAGNEAKLRFGESQLFASRKKDFAQALAVLDVVEMQIKIALSGNGGNGAVSSNKPTTARTAAGNANTDQASWTARRQAVEKPYFEALKNQPANASQLRAVLAFADAKAEAKDFAKALQGLDSLDKLLQAASKTNGAAPDVPTGKVTAAVLRTELEQIRLRAAQGIAQLATALRSDADPRGKKVAKIVTKLSSEFPSEMEPLLERFDAAVAAADANQIESLRAEIQTSAKSMLVFLQKNADYIRGCETNPHGIAIKIADPIRGSLKSIVKMST